MAATPAQLSGSHSITDRFCDEVTERVRGYRVDRVQVQEAIGGIANLYFGAALDKHKTSINTIVDNTFASDIVTKKMIVDEVARCAGTGKHATAAILASVGASLDALLQRKNQLVLPPLGLITKATGRTGTYRFFYTDPGMPHYKRFLL